MKVFLSHSTKDGEFVRALAVALEREGVTPWLCEVDVEPAENFVARIEEGLETADVSLLFWSAPASLSSWTQVEWTSVLAREIHESVLRLGLVRLDGTPLPELLRTKQCFDARSDREAALRKAVDWILRWRRMRLSKDVRSPGCLLDYEPEGFVGRAAVLDRLFEALVEKPRRFLLHGEPGSGKSTLALKFAWQAQGEFDAVVLQVCGQRGVMEIGSELATRLDPEARTLSPEKQIEKARTWLSARRSLLVLDDVWGDDLEPLLPDPPASVLFTSRQSALRPVSPVQAAEVHSFIEEEAEALFRIYLG